MNIRSIKQLTFAAGLGALLMIMPVHSTPPPPDGSFFVTGRSAAVSFWSGHECWDTSVSIFVFDSQKSWTKSAVLVGVDEYDTCGVPGGYQMSALGLAPLPARDFQIEGNLKTARLKAKVWLYDYVTGKRFQVKLDITWKAYSDRQTANDFTMFWGPHFYVRSNPGNTFRYTETTGTITSSEIVFPSGCCSGTGFIRQDKLAEVVLLQ